MTDRLSLFDATPPMRNARRTEVTIECGDAIRLVRDEKLGADTKHDERVLARAAWDALSKAVLALVPLGETRDLVGDKRNNKGVSFNHVALTVGDRTARVDYLPSHVDEDGGDAALRALVDAIRNA